MITSTVPTTTPAATPAASFWTRLTLADALLGLIVAGAALLRFAELGAIPLSPAEAGEAWWVWRFWQPDPGLVTAVPFSPAYFSLTALLSQVLGFGDAAMRLAPALAGLALIAAPWLLRPYLGAVGALSTALLLATSPTQAVISRTAGGDAFALLALLLLAAAGWRYRDGGHPSWLSLAAFALALGLVSSPLFLGGVVTLAAAWLLQRGADAAAAPWPRPDRATLRNATLTFGGTVFVLGTLFLWQPRGIGAAAAFAGQWFDAFAVGESILDWIGPLITLTRYEIGAVSLAVVAAVWAAWRREPWAGWLIGWLAATFILAILQHGVKANVALITLPAYLLAGRLADHIFRRAFSQSALGVAATVVVGLLLVAFNIARYVRVNEYDPENLYYLGIAILALGILVAAVNFVRAFDFAAAAQGTLLGLLVVLAAYNWGTAWWLSHDAANDPRERWVDVGTDFDVRLLVDVLAEIGRHSRNAENALTIASSVDSPALRWYLRDYDALYLGQTIPAGTADEIIITPATASPLLGDDYLRNDFGLALTEATPGAGTPSAILRWWLTRVTTSRPVEERVALWVRADLSGGQPQQ